MIPLLNAGEFRLSDDPKKALLQLSRFLDEMIWSAPAKKHEFIDNEGVSRGVWFDWVRVYNLQAYAYEAWRVGGCNMDEKAVVLVKIEATEGRPC